MAAAGGGSVAVSGFLSSSNFPQKSKSISRLPLWMVARKFRLCARNVVCFAVQESSAAAPIAAVAAETKEKKVEKKEEEKEAETAKGATPPPATAAKPAAKAPAKPLPEEKVIPSLRATLESQEDIAQLELTFQDKKMEGSFLKKGIPYTFWAFFPNGVLTGAKGFSLSSYGSAASTVEPFLIHERRITAKHLVFGSKSVWLLKE